MFTTQYARLVDGKLPAKGSASGSPASAELLAIALGLECSAGDVWILSDSRLNLEMIKSGKIRAASEILRFFYFE